MLFTLPHLRFPLLGLFCSLWPSTVKARNITTIMHTINIFFFKTILLSYITIIINIFL